MRYFYYIDVFAEFITFLIILFSLLFSYQLYSLHTEYHDKKSDFLSNWYDQEQLLLFQEHCEDSKLEEFETYESCSLKYVSKEFHDAFTISTSDIQIPLTICLFLDCSIRLKPNHIDKP